MLTLAPPPLPRPLLSDVLSVSELFAEVERGYVRRRDHETLPLSIYTYTEACVFAGHWTPVTTRCRGLIVDHSTGEVVAWPFPKFHNHSEHGVPGVGKPYAPPLPDEPFEVFDKLDGSLGVVFHYRGEWLVATKGSLSSEQARWAQTWLGELDTSALVPGTTYLAEILYPGNRIVVRHRETGLVLLGAYDPHGGEIRLLDAAATWQAAGGTVVTTRQISSLAELFRLAAGNRNTDGVATTGTDTEGWVVRFESGVRVKVKIPDYIRLHCTITNTTPRTVWAALADGHDPASLFDQVPDEFRDAVSVTVAGLRLGHRQWTDAVRAEFQTLAGVYEDRKAFALRTVGSPHRAALFRLLSGKDIDAMAWAAVKPEPTEPGPGTP